MMQVGDDTPARAKRSAKLGSTHFVGAPAGALGLTFDNLEGTKYTYTIVKTISHDSPLIDKVGVGWILMKVDQMYARA